MTDRHRARRLRRQHASAPNDGLGHDVNPATGQPYAPHVVPRADFARVLAEYWADGPKSETPPGHWNVIANEVADTPGFEPRIGGAGRTGRPARVGREAVSRAQRRGPRRGDRGLGREGLLRLGPADLDDPVHGRARASRAIRRGPSYDPEGLPLEPGLIEVITAESSAPGERHAELADHVGEIAIRAWRGFPKDPTTETSGVGWIRAVDWVPVPAHDVRDAGVRRLPVRPQHVQPRGGRGDDRVHRQRVLPGRPDRAGRSRRASCSTRRARPSDTTLQWATYFDAADQAGLSRLFMGIHIPSRRLRGPQDRRDLRQGRDGPRPALLRRHRQALIRGREDPLDHPQVGDGVLGRDGWRRAIEDRGRERSACDAVRIGRRERRAPRSPGRPAGRRRP